jgi:hypothetical protein
MLGRLLIRMRWLLAAIAALWVVAIAAAGIIDWTVQVWNIAVLFENGGVLFSWREGTGPLEGGISFSMPYDRARDLTDRFGFVSMLEYGIDAFAVPVWAFGLAFGTVAAFSWFLWWRSTKRRVGICPQCAYVVGSANVCSECGCASQIAPLTRAPWMIRTLMWWRWVTLGIAGSLLLVMLATNWIYVRVRLPSLKDTTPVVILSDGGLELDWWFQVLDKEMVEWEWGRRPQWQGWVWWFRRHYTNYWFGVAMPLWMIALVPTLASAGGFVSRLRRRRPDGCAACGTLRGGQSPCPRCGWK